MAPNPEYYRPSNKAFPVANDARRRPTGGKKIHDVRRDDGAPAPGGGAPSTYDDYSVRNIVSWNTNTSLTIFLLSSVPTSRGVALKPRRFARTANKEANKAAK